jgi:hypothetical protein
MVLAGSYSVFVWEFGSPEVWAGEIRVLGFFRTWWGFGGGVCVATTGSSGRGGVRKRNNKMATWDEELGKQAVDPKWTSVWSHGSLRFLLWPSFSDGISGNFFAILFFILSLFSLSWCLPSKSRRSGKRCFHIQYLFYLLASLELPTVVFGQWTPSNDDNSSNLIAQFCSLKGFRSLQICTV